jgi:NAD(P)H-nitrite reductase large subunit
MPKHIVIIGSGIAGVSLAEEIRKLERETRITLLTRERRGYYSRPLLSHAFSRPDIETKIVLKSFAALINNFIAVECSADVNQIDRAAKTIHYRQDGLDKTLPYDTLVLATGSEALVPPPFFPAVGLFHVLNSLEDMIALRKLSKEIPSHSTRSRWAVIGGGLIGCEIAADLAAAGDDVVLFHALPRLMERQLAEADSTTLLGVLREKFAIEVLLDQAVQGFSGSGMDLTVKLAEGEIGGFNAIIVACGFKPRTELATGCDLPVRRGIVVDEYLRTADPDIFAIGDSAELPDGRLYAYVTPARSQALWLAKYLAGQTQDPWAIPAFKPKAKVPGFEAAYPYQF